MESIDGCDHLCVSSYTIVFCYWFSTFSVNGDVGCVFMCDLIGDWVRFCFRFVC